MKHSKYKHCLKIGSGSGFTLIEMVVSLLLIVIISGIMVTGIQLAVNAYHNVVDEANGRVLLTDTIYQLRNEFSTTHAEEIKIEESNTEMEYVFHDSISGGINRKLKNDSDQGLLVMEISGSEEKNERRFAMDLRGAANSNLIINCESFNKVGNTLSFRNLSVTKNGKTIAKQENVIIRIQ